MRKYLLRYTLLFGGLAALSSILFFLGLYAIDPNPLANRRPDIGFNIIFIFAALYYFKRNNGGYLQFYQGFSLGFLVNIFASLLTGIFLFIFVSYIDYQPFATWIAEGKKMLIEQKEVFSKVLNERTLKQQIEGLGKAKPYQLILDDLMFKQFAIVAISLLSIVMRKNRPV